MELWARMTLKVEEGGRIVGCQSDLVWEKWLAIADFGNWKGHKPWSTCTLRDMHTQEHTHTRDTRTVGIHVHSGTHAHLGYMHTREHMHTLGCTHTREYTHTLEYTHTREYMHILEKARKRSHLEPLANTLIVSHETHFTLWPVRTVRP